jgi:hypothetical protein
MHWDSGRIIGEAQRLTESANRQLPFSFHPGGKHLVFTEDRPGTISRRHAPAFEELHSKAR